MQMKFDPITGEPIAEEPITGEPTVKEPIVKKPIAKEPIAEEPITEEPIAEEPIAEEPIAEEPIDEEPIKEEPTVEEPTAEEPIAEEPITEEPIAKEPIIEEPITEEPIAEKPSERIDLEEKSTETEQSGEFNFDPSIIRENSKPKFPKKRVGIIAFVILLCLLSVSVIKADIFKNKNDIINDAFTNLLTADKNSVMNTVFGINELQKGARETGGEFSGEFKIKELANNSQLAGSSVSFDFASAIKKNTYKGAIGFKKDDSKIVDLETYFDKDNIGIKVPQLLDKVILLDTSDAMDTKISKSFLGDYLEENEINELKDAIKAIDKMVSGNQGSQKKYLIRLKDAKNTLFDEMNVTKIDSKKCIIGDKSKNCKGYQVVVSKDSMITFMEELKDAYSEYLKTMPNGAFNSLNGVTTTSPVDELDSLIAQAESNLNDIEMTVYLYKGNIADLQAKSTIDGKNTELALQCKGKNNLKDNMSGELTVDLGSMELDVKLQKVNTKVDDTYKTTVDCSVNGAKVTINNTYNTSTKDFNSGINFAGQVLINCSGTVTDIKKGKSIAADIKQLVINANNENVATLTGNFSWSKSSGNVTMPIGEKVDLFALSSSEFETLLTEIQTNVMKLGQDVISMIY